MEQLVTRVLTTAHYMCEKMSLDEGESFIIESRGSYYVESEEPFVRNGERIIGHYIEGKKQKNDTTTENRE